MCEQMYEGHIFEIVEVDNTNTSIISHADDFWILTWEQENSDNENDSNLANLNRQIDATELEESNLNQNDPLIETFQYPCSENWEEELADLPEANLHKYNDVILKNLINKIQEYKLNRIWNFI